MVAGYLPYSDMSFIIRRIREVGGIYNALRIGLKLRDLRSGELVGTDKAGNKYFQNDNYFFGRDRWVYYIKKDYDASQVAPEWHGWLHHQTDHPPTVKPPLVQKFSAEHVENKSGTDDRFVPYSTTRPKIHSWNPSQQKQS